MKTACPKQKQKYILCVDDDVQTLASLRRVLRPLGHKIITMNNAKTGLITAVLERPDLILLDVHMPKLNGYEFMRLLIKNGMENIPVIMLTADPDMGKAYRQKCGCAYYITKPWETQWVRNIVRYLLNDLSEDEKQQLELEL